MAELGLGAVALVALGPTQVAFYPIACAVATIATTGGLWRLLAPPPDGPEGRGGGGRVDGDGPPQWWPEFERDLREHMRRVDRARAPSGA